MSGTKAGGLKAKHTNIKKYGKDYYVKLGSLPHPRGGFKNRSTFAKIQGAKGGMLSRRGAEDWSYKDINGNLVINYLGHKEFGKETTNYQELKYCVLKFYKISLPKTSKIFRKNYGNYAIFKIGNGNLIRFQRSFK